MSILRYIVPFVLTQGPLTTDHQKVAQTLSLFSSADDSQLSRALGMWAEWCLSNCLSAFCICQTKSHTHLSFIIIFFFLRGEGDLEMFKNLL